MPLPPGSPRAPDFLSSPESPLRRNQMPVILWLLGVPLGIVLLLMLFGVL
ncbi:hypothetical protein LZ009_03595 [Ramlibacter sp. XY19]|nr:hypothetical protein [Ramlibacter paludis]MCG2591855.1 hypothetical protein [Ramlibacter paludis]